ncbi:MAG: BACON domain-containing protein, partial [Bacteroidales bacterium]|nr:BACON domain-containing protein [Candidatus Equibacterium intestinale]
MKKLLSILMMSAVIACAVSCKPDDPVKPVDPENMSALKTAYTIGAEGGSLELQVSANVDFTVTCADPWVKYSTTKAMETKTVVVTVEPNTSTESRTTTVTVKGTEKQLEIKI